MGVLDADKLGRWYGQVVGLNDLTLSLEGGVTGLIGPNGAGKSTFLKLVAGEIKASRGELPLFDYGPGIEALRASCEEETGLPAPIQPVWHDDDLREAAE